MLLAIKWYEDRTGDGDVTAQLYVKFNEIFKDSTVEIKREVEQLSEEVFVLRKIIAAIQAVEGGTPAAVSSGLGLSGYNYVRHLEERLDTAAVVAMGMVINNEYQNLHTLFDELLGLRGETEEVNAAIELLHDSIDLAGGWLALQSAMQKYNQISAGHFRNTLIAAALKVKPPAERMAEVVLLCRIISAIQAAEGGTVRDVSRRLGLNDYSYEKHLQEGLDTAAVVVMGTVINNKYQNLRELFDELLNLRGETEEVNTAMQLLHESIDMAGGWIALHSAMQTDKPDAASRFRNALVAAALRGETAARMAEVVLLYRIISAIQAVEEEGKTAVVSSGLGLGTLYRYVSHLQDGREFDLEVLKERIAAIKKEHTENTELHDNLNDSIDRLEKVKVYDPLQQFRQTFLKTINKKSKSEAANKRSKLLHESIDMAGGWQALQLAMRTSNSSAAGRFRNALVAAALRGETAERMAEVVLLYRIISTIQVLTRENNRAVVHILGLGWDYSYVSHLEEGQEFELQRLKENIKAIKKEHKDKTELHNNLDKSIDLLHKLREEPKQLELPLAD